MRPIDADAFVSEIRERYCKECVRRKGIKNGKMQFLYEVGGVPCRACETEDMLNEVEDAPTVEPTRLLSLTLTHPHDEHFK